MKRLLGSVFIYSICGLSGCGIKDTHEQVLEETLNVLDEMVTRFTSLSRDASDREIAQNAVIFVDAVCSLNRRWVRLPAPTKDAWATMMESKGDRLLNAAVRLKELRRRFRSGKAYRIVSVPMNVWIFNSALVSQYADSLFTPQTNLMQVEAVHLMTDSATWFENGHCITRFLGTGIVVKQASNDYFGREPLISIEYGEPMYGHGEEIMKLIGPNGIGGKDPGIAELYRQLKEDGQKKP